MAIRQGVCTSFKVELLQGIHDFTSDVFKIALYTSSATLNEDTTAYSATDESASSGTARGALIYNSSKANRAVAVLDFGADKTLTTYSAGGDTLTAATPTSSSGKAIQDFNDITVAGLSITFPSPDANNAILRF